MGLIFRLLVCVAMLTAATAAALAQSASARVQVGVGLTPAHFPHQSSTDVESMFREAAAIGTVGFILGRWDDPGFTQTVERMSMLTDRERLATVVQLDIFEPGATQVAPPSGVSGSFEPDTAAAFARTLKDVAAQHPAYIIAANRREPPARIRDRPAGPIRAGLQAGLPDHQTAVARHQGDGGVQPRDLPPGA